VPQRPTIRHIGLHPHTQSLEVCALDVKGERPFRMSVAWDRTALGGFAREVHTESIKRPPTWQGAETISYPLQSDTPRAM
jgi:hypothetical protein